jgi:predicted negative regulator of RcsB-dependent stress response
MDADTRHQLRQNELAEALARLKDFSDRRTLAWIAVILAAVLAYAGYKFWGWRQRADLVAASESLASVRGVLDPSLGEAPLDRLRQIIAENDDPGLVALARLQLGHGLETRAESPEASASLHDAQTQYEEILAMPGAPDSIKAAAVYRLGLIRETEREFGEARKRYGSLVDNPSFRGSPFVDFAKTRLEQLDELAEPVVFEPGMKPLPATQPATAEATTTQASGESGNTAPRAEQVLPLPTRTKPTAERPAVQPPAATAGEQPAAEEPAAKEGPEEAPSTQPNERNQP